MHLRRKIQILSALLLNASFLIELKSICLPVLNCHSCPLSVFGCPIGVIGQFSALHLFPLLTIGLLMVFGALLGRFFCGWCCPFGLLQEMLYFLPTPKLKAVQHLEKCKYGVLLLLVIAVPFFLGKDHPLYFCKICPPATLQSAIPWMIIKGDIPDVTRIVVRLSVLFGVLALVVTINRGFCRILCPLGALMGICNMFSRLRIKQAGADCHHCGICADKCPMDAINKKNKQTRSPECILCLDCTKHCPASRKAGR